MHLDEARQRHARSLLITLEGSGVEGMVESLQTALRAYGQGSCPVAVNYRTPQASARLRLADDWRVQINEALLDQLRGFIGEDAVRVEY